MRDVSVPIVSAFFTGFIYVCICISICARGGINSITRNASIVIIITASIVIIITAIIILVFLGIIAISSSTIFCQEGTPIWAYVYPLVL